MKTFNYDKFSAIKADLENTKEALKNVSQQMVEQFVELIDTACEVYQAIPKSEVPTEKSEEAIRNLLVKVNYHGNSDNFVKRPSTVSQLQKSKQQEIIDLLEKSPGLTRSEIAGKIGISYITATKRMQELVEDNKVWQQTQSGHSGPGKNAFVYQLN